MILDNKIEEVQHQVNDQVRDQVVPHQVNNQVRGRVWSRALRRVGVQMWDPVGYRVEVYAMSHIVTEEDLNG